MSLELARTVADAVLFEGYLLYPYRATSSKNQVRWQFGVLGPPGAADAGLGEAAEMAAECVLGAVGPDAQVTAHLRFLQLQTRSVERATDDPQRFEPVEQLTIGTRSWLSWDEAVEREIALPSYSLADPQDVFPVEVDGGVDIEELRDDEGSRAGRIVRRRYPVRATVTMSALTVDGFVRMGITVRNAAAAPAGDKDEAIRASLIGAHVLLSARAADFVSLLEPPDDAAAAVAGCTQSRCWPVMAGLPGSTDLVLVSPIILYDYPEVADQSAGALFDSTEIDEILTLRVMTLTDAEKAEARATDPRAAEIIDRCDAMSPEALAQLHGILRDPHALAAGALDAAATLDPMAGVDERFGDDVGERLVDLRDVEPPTFTTGDVPWWDPETDASVQPDVDSVLVDGEPVARGSLVRLRPSRRADAQDLFFAGQTARVSAVHSDVDGNVHVAVVLLDDPAAEMHEWYGRFLYFAPDEVEPLPPDSPHPVHGNREESRS
ncbi:MAG: hypothetical protein QOC66_3239 [Pseudonocardiales bacterium]|jgi:hypothetical protein|nr:hypothetical protein [Pseudonocardiales bacterium]